MNIQFFLLVLLQLNEARLQPSVLSAQSWMRERIIHERLASVRSFVLQSPSIHFNGHTQWNLAIGSVCCVVVPIAGYASLCSRPIA